VTLQYSTSVRVLMVLSAVALVVAFGLALLLSPGTSLAAALSRANHQFLVNMQDTLRSASMDWLWTGLVLPLLARPSWLLPLTVAVLCGGGAFSLASRPPATRTHRRRG
jgi:hypothetical protein